LHTDAKSNLQDNKMDTKDLQRNIKKILATGSGYGPEFLPVLKQTNAVLKRINKGRATAENYFDLGKLCIKLEDTGLALEAFKTGYQLNPNHVNCGCYYGLLLEQQGKLTEALSIYIELNKIAPENIMLVERMLEIFYEKKDYDQVFKICQHFLKSGANYAVIYEYISKIYFDYGNVKQATEHLKNALSIEPENEKYIQRLILYYYRNKDYDSIIKYNDYITSTPSVPIAITLLFVNSLAATGKNSEARNYFAKLLSRKDDRFTVLVEVALFHQNFEQNIRKGIFINEYILKREPTNVHALSNLALLMSDEFTLSAYKKVYEQLPDNPVVRMNYGFNLLIDGQLEKGFQLYESRRDIGMKFLMNRLNYPKNISGKKVFLWSEQGI